jgi:hypothetical protein
MAWVGEKPHFMAGTGFADNKVKANGRIPRKLNKKCGS